MYRVIMLYINVNKLYNYYSFIDLKRMLVMVRYYKLQMFQKRDSITINTVHIHNILNLICSMVPFCYVYLY